MQGIHIFIIARLNSANVAFKTASSFQQHGNNTCLQYEGIIKFHLTFMMTITNINGSDNHYIKSGS